MSQERESRPAGNGTATDLGADQIDNNDPTASHPQQPGSSYARRVWARALIERAKPGPIPAYGSIEWIKLPEGHAAKIAAVVVAAESWVTDGENLPARIALEVETLTRAHKRAEDADYVAGIAAHREQWQHLSQRMPTGQRGDASVPLEEIGRRYRLQVLEGGRGGAA